MLNISFRTVLNKKIKKTCILYDPSYFVKNKIINFLQILKGVCKPYLVNTNLALQHKLCIVKMQQKILVIILFTCVL